MKPFLTKGKLCLASCSWRKSLWHEEGKNSVGDWYCHWFENWYLDSSSLSQVDELEGWTNYMERYTAVKRKMDWILQLCELNWSTEHEITKNIDKDIFMDSFDFLIYRYIFSMCTSEVNCLSPIFADLFNLLHIYHIWLWFCIIEYTLHVMYVVLISVGKICKWWLSLANEGSFTNVEGRFCWTQIKRNKGTERKHVLNCKVLQNQYSKLVRIYLVVFPYSK